MNTNPRSNLPFKMKRRSGTTIIEGLFGLAIVVLAILLIIFFPMAVIWALNTLFPVLAIKTTFWTWLAVIIIGAFFRGQTAISNNKD